VTLPTTEAPSAFVPSGRPVVRFVVMLASVAAVFAGLGWSGVFAARVHVSVSDEFDPLTNTGIAVVDVRNEGPLGTRVGPLTLSSRRDGGSSYEPLVRVTGKAPRREVRLDSDDTMRFTVRYAVECTGYDRARNSERGAVSPSLRLRLHTRGFLGSGRSISASDVALVGACGDPIAPGGGITTSVAMGRT
jgi:hypothetical protein